MPVPEAADKTSFISNIPDLINAVVSCAWVVLAGLAFWKFYGSLKSAIDSRSLSVEIGGFKLSFQEAAEGLKTQISDLQSRLGKLEKSLEEPHAQMEQPTGKPEDLEAPQSQMEKVEYSTDVYSAPTLRLHVLWVDDNPKGNAYIIGTIQSEGGTVDTAVSTSEGLAKFESSRYDAVITDLDRRENGAPQGTAGIEFIQAIRQRNKKVPIFVYTSSLKAVSKKNEVENVGADGVTSSAVELFKLLRYPPRR